MDLKGKKVLVVSTLDDMIGRFMIPHIKEMQRLGAIVDCACKNTGDFYSEIQKETNCNVYDLPFTRFPFTINNIKGYNTLKKICKANNYDLINCLQPVGGAMGRLIAKKYKLPCLYTAHGFHFYKGAPLKNRIIYKTIENYLSKYTTSLVTMNEEDYLASKKMKAKNTYKINGIGVDLSKYKIKENFDKAEFRKSLGLNEGDFVVASVGELNKNKNTLMLVDAINNTKEKNIKLLVCGEGELHSLYDAKIKEFGLENRVKMLGFRKDVPDILNCVDCYIMPSFREGLSKSMMEAMAYGLPIIASKIRGNIDLVGNNEGGILVSPDDIKGFTVALDLLANNEELCKKFGERNKNKVQEFALEKVKSQFEKIYEEL